MCKLVDLLFKAYNTKRNKVYQALCLHKPLSGNVFESPCYFHWQVYSERYVDQMGIVGYFPSTVVNETQTFTKDTVTVPTTVSRAQACLYYRLSMFVFISPMVGKQSRFRFQIFIIQYMLLLFYGLFCLSCRTWTSTVTEFNEDWMLTYSLSLKRITDI